MIRRTISAEWSGLLAPPTPHYLSFVQSEFDRAARDWAFTPLVESFTANLRRLLLEPRPLPAMLTNAIHSVDWEPGAAASRDGAVAGVAL